MNLLLLAAGAILLWVVLSRLFQRRPIISIVLLVEAPRRVDDDALRATLQRIFNRRLADDPKQPNALVRLNANALALALESLRLGLVHQDQPYFDDAAAVAAPMVEQRRKDAVLRHRAWLSVDYAGALSDEDRDDVYRVLGRIAAELAGDDCLAVLATESGYLVPFDEDVRDGLRTGRWLSGRAGPVPILQIADDDPRMLAAVAEARARWPEFAAAFAARTPGQHFSVKAPFTEEGRTEFMWLAVDEITADTIRGRLGNMPHRLRTLREGARVEVPVARLNDWMYVTDEGSDPVGGFTVQVLVEAAKKTG